MDILTQIERYAPYNEQETRDKSVMLDCLNAFADVFTRDNALCHMTASAWVVNERFDRVLMWSSGDSEKAKTAAHAIYRDAGRRVRGHLGV